MALNKKYFVVRNALFSYSSILMKNSEDQDYLENGSQPTMMTEAI